MGEAVIAVSVKQCAADLHRYVALQGPGSVAEWFDIQTFRQRTPGAKQALVRIDKTEMTRKSKMGETCIIYIYIYMHPDILKRPLALCKGIIFALSQNVAEQGRLGVQLTSSCYCFTSCCSSSARPRTSLADSLQLLVPTFICLGGCKG